MSVVEASAWYQNAAIGNGDAPKRWKEKIQFVAENRPDIVCFQEVCGRIGREALKDLEGDGYIIEYHKSYPGQEDSQGMAIASLLPLLDVKKLAFGGRGNQIQFARLDTGTDKRLVVVNLHHEAPPRKELLRVRKNQGLVHYLHEEAGDDAQLVGGDFNGLFWFPSVMVMRQAGYKSAFRMIHGKKGATFPDGMTPKELRAGRFITESEERILGGMAVAAGLFGKKVGYTLDHVFVNDDLIPIEAKLVSGVSDHKGELIKFRLRQPTASLPALDTLAA